MPSSPLVLRRAPPQRPPQAISDASVTSVRAAVRQLEGADKSQNYASRAFEVRGGEKKKVGRLSEAFRRQAVGSGCNSILQGLEKNSFDEPVFGANSKKVVNEKDRFHPARPLLGPTVVIDLVGASDATKPTDPFETLHPPPRVVAPSAPAKQNLPAWAVLVEGCEELKEASSFIRDRRELSVRELLDSYFALQREKLIRDAEQLKANFFCPNRLTQT